MKDLLKEAICPNGDWTGDATGITSCPVCGATLSILDSFDEEENDPYRKEKYPDDFLAKIDKVSDDME